MRQCSHILNILLWQSGNLVKFSNRKTHAMILKSKTHIAALLIAALPAFATLGTITALSTGAAMAQGNSGNGNGNGNSGNGNGNGGNGNGNSGNGNGNGQSAAQGNGNSQAAGHGNGGNNGRGVIARELRGANAARANEQAFLNAAANSQVGRLGELRRAISETSASYSDWQTAYSGYVTYRDSYAGRDSAAIQSEIDGLDPLSATFDTDLAALDSELTAATTYELEVDRLVTISNAAAATYESASEIEEQAVLVATNGRTLSEEAMAELRRILTQ